MFIDCPVVIYIYLFTRILLILFKNKCVITQYITKSSLYEPYAFISFTQVAINKNAVLYSFQIFVGTQKRGNVFHITTDNETLQHTCTYIHPVTCHAYRPIRHYHRHTSSTRHSMLCLATTNVSAQSSNCLLYTSRCV